MKNRKLTFLPELESIILKCDVCSLSMVDQNNQPYVLHMNFGYEEQTVYFHGSQEGRKIDVLKNNPEVCIAFSSDHDLRWVNEEVACSWGMRYRSVLIYGKVEFIEDADEKVNALNIIMKNYTDRDFSYSIPAVRDVMIMKVKIDRIDGRTYGY